MRQIIKDEFMSLITHIIGWIEIDQFDDNYEYNKTVLNELINTINDENYEGFLKNMFCTPDDCGSKNPGYITFGASINYGSFSIWLDEFEEFIEKLRWFGAFVFCEHHDGDNVYVIGYYKSKDAKDSFIKDVIELGESYDYDNIYTGSHYERDRFPLIFDILKSVITGSHSSSKISHRNIHHMVLKYGEVLTKSDNDVYEFKKEDFDIVDDDNSIKLIKKNRE